MKRTKIYLLLLVAAFVAPSLADTYLRIRHADNSFEDQSVDSISEIRFLHEAQRELMRISFFSDSTSDQYQWTDAVLVDIVPRYTYDTVLRKKTFIDTLSVDSTRVLGYVTDSTKSQNIVAVYVPTWASKLPDPMMATHINYGFAELYMDDSIYNGFKLKGGNNLNKLNECLNLKKQNPNLKVLLSFSHTVNNYDNTQSGGFSKLSASDANRKQFASDCRAYCLAHNLDGIDIDWEFPTLNWAGQACSEDDPHNFTLLMKTMRDTMGPDFLITYCGYCMANKFFEDNVVAQYIDFVNIMCYDMMSAPSPHNAMSCPGGYWDIQRTYNSFKNAKYPMNKIVLGVPFYGHHKTGEDGELYYCDILTRLRSSSGTWISKFHNTWQVPVLYKVTNNKQEMWCSYDSPQSLLNKGNWALRNGLLGLVGWQSSGDDSKHALQNAMWNAIRCREDSVWEYQYTTQKRQGYDTIIHVFRTEYNDTIIHHTETK